MMNWHKAVEQMHKGKVVQYVGTVNGNVWTESGGKFCMLRGTIFLYPNPALENAGAMVYDPDFRYVLTPHTVNTRDWI